MINFVGQGLQNGGAEVAVRGIYQDVRAGNVGLPLHTRAHGVYQRRVQAEHVQTDDCHLLPAVAEDHGGSVEVVVDGLHPQVRPARLERAPHGRRNCYLCPSGQ